ncbi:hypothetical protein CN645_16525 [Burkholderia sp. IDO3]|nr:hypothetical protein DCN14_34990 [Burkholderia sp. IDO3]PCD60721.1 hypothetical protein CN645_16525 [Burkholderia sp. IDO3]
MACSRDHSLLDEIMVFHLMAHNNARRIMEYHELNRQTKPDKTPGKTKGRRHCMPAALAD